MSKVCVILTNYSRPQNMQAVIAAWRGQSALPARVVVVDNSIKRTAKEMGVSVSNTLQEDPWMELYPNHKLDGADDVWRWTENLGPPCRFAPAFCLLGYDYFLFADDDLLPGSRALETLLATADKLEGNFTTLGAVGRTFKHLGTVNSYVYDRRDTPRTGRDFDKTDVTCRLHLVPCSGMKWVIPLRERMLYMGREIKQESADRLVSVHDDMLLCLSGQLYGGFQSFVLPRQSDPECEPVRYNLANGEESIWKRPQHFAERQEFIDLAVRCGWRSLVR